MGEAREQILALMKENLPKCPICKANGDYRVIGWWPWFQYVECKSCRAQYTSSDFSKDRGLTKLELWKAPQVPDILAKFRSASPFKVHRSYSWSIWKSLAEGKETEIVSEKSYLGFISSNKKGLSRLGITLILTILGFQLTSNLLVGSLLLSFGLSLVAVLFGHYFADLNKNELYTIFIATWVAIWVGLITLFDIKIKL